jgi:hypothetical protein
MHALARVAPAYAIDDLVDALPGFGEALERGRAHVRRQPLRLSLDEFVQRAAG